MGKQWRCGVVGMGAIGEWHMRVINTLPNADFVACCDVLTDRAQAVMEKNKVAPVPVYLDLGQMLANQKLDVVHIATPSGSHLEPALQIIEAGVNVICEKPVEITLERIDKMIGAAAKKKVRLGCIFQNRWNPANRAIYDAMQAGRFGRIAWAGCFTPWYRTDEYYRSGGWRGTWKLDGGGAMMNQSVHAIDLLQWIAGPVKTVSAYASSRIHAEIEVEDTCTAALQFQNGAYGSMMGSTAMYPGGSVRLEIGGEFGTAVAVAEEGLRTFAFKDARPADNELMEKINANRVASGGGSSQFLATIDNHVANVASILKAWDEDREAETNGVEARKAIAIILATYESARKNGQPVAVS